MTDMLIVVFHFMWSLLATCFIKLIAIEWNIIITPNDRKEIKTKVNYSTSIFEHNQIN